MTFTPALVALDIDGTIVSVNGDLPGDVHDAVRRVVAAGVPVVLTTGRAWAGTQKIFDALGLPPGPSVCANGAMIVNYPPVEVLHEARFDPADSISRVARLAPNAAIAVTDGMLWRVSTPFPEGELNGDFVVESVEELASRPVSRIVVHDPETDDDVFTEMVEALGLREVSYYMGWSSWVDIVPKDVDKARGLEQVCGELGVAAADVLALGDGYNDIEMIRWAGRGVAMGDAPHDVRAAADHVTGDFESGGTVQELERWF
ncbi:HAD family hydrolase [Arachnia propionica]|uniref:HAD family hydrolase n=1 Tax=Arachnia propionica TaxID=1750 RepID=UPI0030CB6666